MSQAIPYLAFSLSATDLTGTTDGSPANKSLPQDWNNSRSYQLPGGGSAKPSICWVSVSGSTTGTSVIFAIETSMDAISWASMGGITAITGNGIVSLNAQSYGSNLIASPLRYLRLTETGGASYTDGIITWGII